jgi:phosphate transport system permease protein
VSTPSADAAITAGPEGLGAGRDAEPPRSERPGNQDARSLASRSRGGDAVFRIVAAASGLLVLVILAFIAVSTTREALPAFQQEGLGFILSNDWVPNEGRFGALAFVFGTIGSALIALVIAVPISLGIALLANEAAPRRLVAPIAYVVDLLAAIPSVVFGLWGLLVLAPFVVNPDPNVDGIYERVAGAIGSWPVLGAVFGGDPRGKSFMTAGLILAVMIIPIVTSLSREVIATVPSHQREAALAMGATRWEMIRSAVIPWARGGLVGSVMLGLGRAMGETIAAALVIGSSPQITTFIFGSGDSMPAVIANQFGEASGMHRSALIGLGVVLFGLTIIVNMSARTVVSRFDARAGRV